MKETQKRVEDISDDDYILINNALAALNVLGIYYLHRYIPRKDVLELWAVPTLRAFMAADVFISYRDAENGMPTWPHLREFCEHARKYTQRAGLVVQAPGPRPEMQQPADQEQSS
jgi:hypothetical protein